MIIAHNRWDSGVQDVKLHDRGTAPQRFDRLRSARRLGLMRSGVGGELYVELKQVQVGENDHPTRRKVELADLSLGAGGMNGASRLTACGEPRRLQMLEKRCRRC
jgi:hypothetical protein